MQITFPIHCDGQIRTHVLKGDGNVYMANSPIDLNCRAFTAWYDQLFQAGDPPHRANTTNGTSCSFESNQPITLQPKFVRTGRRALHTALPKAHLRSMILIEGYPTA